jgi:uncharacterized protein involved in exopolysaccharide biosynthesis
MNLKLFLAIIRSSMLFIVVTLAISIATAAAITKMQPNRYAAGTSIVIDFQNDRPFETTALPAQLAESYMATQLDILRSPTVAKKVVEALGLERDAAARAELLPPDLAPVGVEASDRLIAQLAQDVQVEPSRDSRVVTIAYVSTDPRRAASIANAFAQAYIDTSLELSMEPARRNATWFDEQLQVLRGRLDDAQARLTAFQQESGIVALDERLDTETSQLNELTRQLVEAQAQTYDVQSRGLGTNHPDYQRAVQREQALLNNLDEQKRRYLELRQQRDRLNALARDVSNEQQNYEATLQNYYRISLESQFNNSNIAILSPAVVPQTPVSPNVRLNLLGGAFLGLLLGVVLAVVLELVARRVRTKEDVQEFLGVPVLETV